MPFTAAQLTSGAKYMLDTYQKENPIDQIGQNHETLSWLIKNMIPSTYGNGSFREPVLMDYGSNYQNYFGADQVTYNSRDPAMWTQTHYSNNHDGFYFDEDRLLAAGITLTDDGSAQPTAAEKGALIDLLKTSFTVLKSGIQQNLAKELLLDGSGSPKAATGLAAVVSATTGQTICGIDSGTYTWWENQYAKPASGSDIAAELESLWRKCRRYGGSMPNAIFCGSAAFDKYVSKASATINRQITGGGSLKGGVTYDASTNAAYFHGVQLVWDPDLDDNSGSSLIYLLNSQFITLRPVKGNWMVDRRPERLPDRYVYYFGQTSKYGLTTNKRRGLGLLDVSLI